MEKRILIGVLAALLTGCYATKSVETYTTPKREFESAAVQESVGLQWETPAKWQEKPASGMRVAGFLVGDIERDLDRVAEASIIVLGGDGGGLVSNVNRWRGQIGLSPASAAEITTATRREKGALGSFQWFSLVNPEIDQGILIAVIQKNHQTVFIKLTGPLKTLAENKQKFLELCRSVK